MPPICIYMKAVSYKCAFSAIAAVASWPLLLAAPCSNTQSIRDAHGAGPPHVCHIHCGSLRGGYSGFALALRASRWLLSPLRSGSLHLLPWMACMSVLQEHKTDHKKITILRGVRKTNRHLLTAELLPLLIFYLVLLPIQLF